MFMEFELAGIGLENNPSHILLNLREIISIIMASEYNRNTGNTELNPELTYISLTYGHTCNVKYKYIDLVNKLKMIEYEE